MDDLTAIAQQCHDDSAKWFPESAHDLTYMGLALCGEAGEFANEVKKIVRGDVTVQQALPFLREELADVFIYLMNLVELLKMDLTQEYIRKREINLARFGSNNGT